METRMPSTSGRAGIKDNDEPKSTIPKTALDKDRVTGQNSDAVSTCVSIKGASQNNLKNFDIDIPRNAFVAFTGISGSGKSSLAFETIYAESQRRYFESIAPYARRLLQQLPAPVVQDIQGLPPAVALEQRRTDSNSRSTVGTITNLSNSLRMLYSRAGDYPSELKERLDSDAFSSNTPQGACEDCHGTGVVHDVTEDSLVPDPELSIREKAIAAWPGAWQGKNYRDILDTLGYDVDSPFKNLSKKDREWILFTEEKPVVTVHPVREAHRIQRPYKGTYMSAASYVRHTFATTQSATMRRRVAQFMESSPCGLCEGKRLNKKALSVKFAGYDIAELGKMSFSKLSNVLEEELHGILKKRQKQESGKHEVAASIVKDLLDKIGNIADMGLDYLSLERSAPTLSQGEMQRLRLVTQLSQGLFSVVYILDEPSAGLHPVDTRALLEMLSRLKGVGNSLFVVEHEMDIVRQADWIVDIGPGAGVGGGELIYSGPVNGLAEVPRSHTGRYLFKKERPASLSGKEAQKAPSKWIELSGINRNNIKDLEVKIPLGLLTAVTGVSGAGKSTLVSKVLASSVEDYLDAEQKRKKQGKQETEEETLQGIEDVDDLEELEARKLSTLSIKGLERISRLVSVDQKPIGRTPRSNLATYTGLFDHVRKLFASQSLAKERKYKAGRFSFNVDGGRCSNCEGEGFVSVELLFLPSVYAPCSSCRGSRYNKETLGVTYEGKNIAQILGMSVEEALAFFEDLPPVHRALKTLNEIGLGYLTLGQPATELSGGEAQRIKLASELQRTQKGSTLYLLDEPTTGLHPHDTERLMKQLKGLVASGNTVIVVEHDLDVISEADWIIDMGPGAGDKGGRVVACGSPATVSESKESKTAPFIRSRL